MGEIPFLKRIKKSVGNSLGRIEQGWSEATFKIGSRIPRGVTALGGLTIGASELVAGLYLSESILYRAPFSLPVRGALALGTVLATAAVEAANTTTISAMIDARQPAQEGLEG